MITGQNSQSQSGRGFQPTWVVEVRRFPDGVDEVTAALVREVSPRQTDRGLSPYRDANRRRAARRASVMLRRRIRAADMRYLWTFTFPGEGVHEWDRATGLFEAWVHRFGNAWLEGSYVWVPEWHPGGHGLHMHLVTDKRLDVNEVRASWTRWLRWHGMEPTGGARWVIVDVQKFRSARAAGRYVGKYVSKAFEQVPFGRQRYRLGNAVVPVQGDRFRLSGYVDDVLPLVYAQVTGPLVASWFSWQIDDWEGPPAFGFAWRRGAEGAGLGA